MVLAAAAAILVRPRLFTRPHVILDAALATCLIAIAIQLLPVSPGIRAVLSPEADQFERQLMLGEPAGRRALSLDPVATRWALAIASAVVAVFWSARTMFERQGGVRSICRAVSWIGLVLAAVAFVQRALSPGLIYGFWEPLDKASKPTPWGPFVNRNDFATWLMMAVPLTLGYLLARLTMRARERRPVNIESMLDARMVWLAASVCLMTAALVGSLSRSGLMGLAVALCILLALARTRFPRTRMLWLTLGIAAVVLFAAAYADLPALAARLESTLPSGLGGRLAVWRETWPMARDFPIAGVGAGAFMRAMLVYQESTRLIFFNHAHNEYLQVLVEGGLLLALPAALALAAGVFGIVRRLSEDRTPLFWIRAGAASGVAAVAAQSVWDTGLRLPANAALFAVLVAIALHDGGGGRVAGRSHV